MKKRKYISLFERLNVTICFYLWLMYSPAQVKQLQADTNLWLDEKQKSIANIESLRNILRFHEHRYYVLNDPLISDIEIVDFY